MTKTTTSISTRKRGKKYEEKAALVDMEKKYTVEEAAELLTKVSPSKFDATAEIHIKINADTTQADQLVRTTVALPHGTGKTVRIAAFVQDDQADAAKKAGADIAGISTLLPLVEQEKLDFDIAVASPDVMKELGKVAKILGQRGLMPNPKAGTVTMDIAKTIDELKKGRIECKMDKQESSMLSLEKYHSVLQSFKKTMKRSLLLLTKQSQLELKESTSKLLRLLQAWVLESKYS